MTDAMFILEVYHPGPVRTMAGPYAGLRAQLDAIRAGTPAAEFVLHEANSATRSAFPIGRDTPQVARAKRAIANPCTWIHETP